MFAFHHPNVSYNVFPLISVSDKNSLDKTLVQITLKDGKNIENFISHSHLRFISTGFQGVCHTSDIDQRKPPNVLSMSTTSLRK